MKITVIWFVRLCSPLSRLYGTLLKVASRDVLDPIRYVKALDCKAPGNLMTVFVWSGQPKGGAHTVLLGSLTTLLGLDVH
jgi:hypothetical protein